MDGINHEELSRCLFEQSGDALFIFDPGENQILDANSAAERLTGMRRKQLLGMTLPNLLRADDGDTIDELMHAYRSTGGFHSQAGYRLRSENNGPVAVNVSVSRIHTNPRPLGLVVVRGISQRRRAEEALLKAHKELELHVEQRTADSLHRNEARLQAIFAASLDPIIAIDSCGIVQSASDSVEKVFGWRPAELIGKSVNRLMPERYRSEHGGYLDANRPNGARNLLGKTRELAGQRKDGSTFPCEVTLNRVDIPDRAETLFMAVVRDVTERKQAGRALKDSQELYRSLVENLPQNIFRKDLDGRITFANQGFCKTVGRSLGDIVGKTDADLYPPELANKYRADDQLVVATGEVFEAIEEHFPPGGDRMFVRVVKTPVYDPRGELIGVQGIFWDITRRVQAEEALRASEARFAAFMRNLPGVAFMKDLQGRYLFFNDQLERLHRLERDDWYLKTSSDVFSPELAKWLDEQSRLIISEGKAIEFVERILAEEPDREWLVHKFPITESDGTPSLIGGIGIEITDRRIAERSLQESERQLSNLMRNLPGMVYRCVNEREWPVEFVSQGCLELTGYEPFHFIERKIGFGQLIHSDDADRVWSEIQTALREKRSYQLVYRITDRRGCEHWVWEKGGGVYSPEDQLLFLEGFVTDITERKQAEDALQQHREELVHMNRVSIMGEMASGMAHELNQPLTAIATFADACLMKLKATGDDSADLAPTVAKIRDQALRAGAIIHRLRKLVKKEAVGFEPVDFGRTIDNVLKLLHTELQEEGVAVTVELADALPLLNGDEIQLEQIVLNLIRNAADAMRENNDHERQIALQAVPSAEETVEITVQDTGPGMSDETLDQVFDAFFTTKTQGMGMGLAICRTIIESNGGTISVSRNPDRGVTFRVSLPISPGGRK